MVRIYVPKMDDSFFCTDDGRPDHNWTHRHTGCLHAWPAVVGWAKDRLTITKADIGRLFLNKKGNLCRILFVSVEQEDGIHPVTAVERPSEKVFHLSEDGFWVNHRYTSDLDFDTWYTNKVEEKEETLDGKQVTIDGKTYQLTLKK